MINDKLTYLVKYIYFVKYIVYENGLSTKGFNKIILNDYDDNILWSNYLSCNAAFKVYSCWSLPLGSTYIIKFLEKLVVVF